MFEKKCIYKYLYMDTTFLIMLSLLEEFMFCIIYKSQSLYKTKARVNLKVITIY